MNLIGERKIGDVYEVAYAFLERNIIKVVRIDYKELLGKPSSSLEIQKIGLEFLLERLEFEEGQATISMTLPNPRSMSPSLKSLDERPEEKNQLLKRYATEFEPIFESNMELKKHLPTKFREIQEYLR